MCTSDGFHHGPLTILDSTTCVADGWSFVLRHDQLVRQPAIRRVRSAMYVFYRANLSTAIDFGQFWLKSEKVWPTVMVLMMAFVGLGRTDRWLIYCPCISIFIGIDESSPLPDKVWAFYCHHRRRRRQQCLQSGRTVFAQNYSAILPVVVIIVIIVIKI